MQQAPQCAQHVVHGSSEDHNCAAFGEERFRGAAQGTTQRAVTELRLEVGPRDALAAFCRGACGVWNNNGWLSAEFALESTTELEPATVQNFDFVWLGLPPIS